MKEVLLTIDLQRGFSQDTVILFVDGKEAFHKEQVTSQTHLGLADSCEVMVRKALLSVDISVPARGIQESVLVDITDELYMGISLAADTINYVVSDSPLTYG